MKKLLILLSCVLVLISVSATCLADNDTAADAMNMTAGMNGENGVFVPGLPPTVDLEKTTAVPETATADHEIPPLNPEKIPVEVETTTVDPENPPIDPETPPVDPENPPIDPEIPPVDPENPPIDPETPPVDPAQPKKLDKKLLIAIIGGAVVLCAVVITVVMVIRKKKKKNVLPPLEPVCSRKYVVRAIGSVLTGQEFVFLDSFCVGRDKSLCELVLPMDTSGVSGVHCKIFCDQKGVFLMDCDSCGGTYVDNLVRLEADQKYPLASGSCFYVGSQNNAFVIYY